MSKLASQFLRAHGGSGEIIENTVTVSGVTHDLMAKAEPTSMGLDAKFEVPGM